jgi:glycopeptide antibiotics resistance protein
MSDIATKSKPPGVLAIILFVVYALLLVGVILFKFPFNYELTSNGRELNLIPFGGSFADHRFGASEVVENVLVFVPLGLYLSMVARWSLGRNVLTILATSVALEAIQYAFAIGRSDITDVLENTVGGMLGIGIYVLANKALRHHADRVLTIVALIVTVVALAFFTFLKAHSR